MSNKKIFTQDWKTQVNLILQMPKVLTTVTVGEVSQWMMLLCAHESELSRTDYMATGNLGTYGHFTYLFRTLL